MVCGRSAIEVLLAGKPGQLAHIETPEFSRPLDATEEVRSPKLLSACCTQTKSAFSKTFHKESNYSIKTSFLIKLMMVHENY